MRQKFAIVYTRFLPMMSLLAVLAIWNGAAAQPQQVQIQLAAAPPEVVWRYQHRGAPCAADDYADVPVRPFLVNGRTAGTYRVLWFAANSNGYFASETAGPDVTPGEVTLQHFKRRPHCRTWVHSRPYNGSNPKRYYTGLWMVAPFTEDGTNIYALAHNEFHGEWTTSNRWCSVHRDSIYLPCDYWNLVSAFSTDGARHFALRQIGPNWNQPAIALAEPYTPNWVNRPPVPLGMPPQPSLPQGMTAQSNIIEQDGFAYVLAQQTGTSALVPAS